ncbi:MAG TPA: SH3 domain-containing protein, partial [Thermomicrobiales bacterium]|nr:SH3 domain-containing protein [Thermomicrobiales bacterium]
MFAHHDSGAHGTKLSIAAAPIVKTNVPIHRHATRRQFAKGLLAIPTIALGAGFLRPATGLAVSQFAVGDRVVVNTDYLNLRAGVGTDQDVIDALAYGTAATVTASPTSASADGFDWVEIQTDGGGAGWVADDYLTAESGSSGGGGNLF